MACVSGSSQVREIYGRLKSRVNEVGEKVESVCRTARRTLYPVETNVVPIIFDALLGISGLNGTYRGIIDLLHSPLFRP